MDIDLNGKVALITGAARGIGLVVAGQLATEGVNICGVDHRSTQLAGEMSRLAEHHGVKTMAIATDIGQEGKVIEMVGQVFSKWGRIDILVNNAGIRQVAPIYETPVSVWDNIHSSNLRGQFLCTREVLKQAMLKHNEGVIIFVSSDAGKNGSRGSSAYSASKFGVRGLAESVAKDLKNTKIRCTVIMPGPTWTPMAEESEYADQEMEWLESSAVSNAILFCIKQNSNTIIPEMEIYHRTQI